MTAQELQAHLRSLGSAEAAALAARFFKTGPGEYGEGDIFLGIKVPVLRTIAKEHRTLPHDETLLLLRSEIHEVRLLALMIWVLQVAKTDNATKREVYKLYLAHTRHINNWDLVDASSKEIVGGYLYDKNRAPLYRLARSKNLWERRIAIVSSHFFIQRGDHAETLALAELLIGDPHDLMHKATGWMLREVGKRDQATLEGFLATHHRTMPRTMLRYAIERFPEAERRAYLARS